MTAERVLAALPPTADATASEADRTPGRARPRPSATRGASLSRSNRVYQLRQGNVNSLRHGVFAKVQAAQDVATEIALTLVAHPDLDPVRDRRLVEHLATTRVSRQRALLAMETDGLTQILTSYDARLSPLEERLERTVDERERRRIAERAKGDADPLARYRSGGGS